MKENPRKDPSKKYPDKNIPLKDPDPTANNPNDPHKDSDKKQYLSALLSLRLM